MLMYLNTVDDLQLFWNLLINREVTQRCPVSMHTGEYLLTRDTGHEAVSTNKTPSKYILYRV